MFSRTWEWTNIKNWQKLYEVFKKLQILSKNAKMRDIKMLTTITLLLETMQYPINKPQRRLPGPWS